jgi:hypothetical protein
MTTGITPGGGREAGEEIPGESFPDTLCPGFIQEGYTAPKAATAIRTTRTSMMNGKIFSFPEGFPMIHLVICHIIPRTIYITSRDIWSFLLGRNSGSEISGQNRVMDSGRVVQNFMSRPGKKISFSGEYRVYRSMAYMITGREFEFSERGRMIPKH